MIKNVVTIGSAIHAILITISVAYGQDEPAAAVGARPRIGGRDAPVGRFPYMCSVRRRGDRRHVCGAVLIHPQWVVTAAHCIDPELLGTVGLLPLVYCGIHDINDDNPSTTFNVQTTHVHESWTGSTIDGYDIAALQLDRKVTGATIPTRDVSGYGLDPGVTLAAIGWGETLERRQAKVLQMTPRLSFVTTRTCNRLWDGIINADTMICAGSGTYDACQGDSGGPLILLDAPAGYETAGQPSLDLIVGLTSFGEQVCGDTTRPGVYTIIGFFYQWINDILNGVPDTSVVRNPPSVQSPNVPVSLPSPVTPIAVRTGPIPESLVTAVIEDDADLVEDFLASGTDPNGSAKDSEAGDSLLHRAAWFGSANSARVTSSPVCTAHRYGNCSPVLDQIWRKVKRQKQRRSNASTPRRRKRQIRHRSGACSVY